MRTRARNPASACAQTHTRVLEILWLWLYIFVLVLGILWLWLYIRGPSGAPMGPRGAPRVPEGKITRKPGPASFGYGYNYLGEGCLSWPAESWLSGCFLEASVVCQRGKK